MGQLIAMPDDACGAVLRLLPWHLTGTLDAADEELVGRHLAGCATCRAELARERALATAVHTAEPRAGDGWAGMSALLDRAEPRPRQRARAWVRRSGALGSQRTWRWIAGAQFAALLVLGTWVALPSQRAPAYRALGDASQVRAGNALVMFRPETSEAALRRSLAEADARLVDGPTASGAYVIALPGDGTALARLRAQPAVTLAEPIERGSAP
ncbi:zf-HC2 domain-containing protein [Sphingomonas sp. BK235]|uniref:zf-HC2 domain-containing protein n=1 Tax=Sphingomonas sp. BK235 TaxID=2512131 RepID=UPI0010467ED5|nr:zf-HC2 domain-containing protein [Sphingomonas sp. BK235]TCP31045.1 putative zinc finger protein [Sphingomonas sp. BK235]